MASSIKTLGLKIVRKDSAPKLTEIKSEQKEGESRKMSEENSGGILDAFDVPEIDENAIKAAALSEEGIRDESGGAITYAFIGAGQGGSRIAESFYNNFKYRKVIALNTAENDLAYINIPPSQKLVMKLDELSGAGKDMTRGAAAAKKYSQDVYNLMKKVFGKCERIIVCIGAGGGTGGGSVWTLLDLARKYLNYIGLNDVEKRIGVICSIPENGECASPIVAENAVAVINPLCDAAESSLISPLIFIDNGKVRKLYPNLTVNNYWKTVNKAITGLHNVFNVMATKNSEFTSFDSADYDKIMGAGGCLIMGATQIKDFADRNAVGASIKSNLEKSLFADGFDLTSAKAVGSIVIGGDVLFNTVPGLLDNINYGFDTLANITGNAELYRGLYSEQGKDNNKIVIYNILTGLTRPTKRINEISRFIKSSGKNASSIYDDKGQIHN